MSTGKPDDKPPQIIIRRRRGGDHGGFHGAWKIALADFMTTMMALFLVLWVIATATPQQRRGLSNYFSTTLTQAIGAGDRENSSDSAIPGGGPDHVYTEGETARVHLRAQDRITESRRRLRHLRDRLIAAIAADKNLQGIKNQLMFEMTPQGLRIIVVDTDQRPMFELGSDQLEPYMSELLKAIAPLLNELPNEISIYGHTDSRPYAGGEAGYSNWELSTARANASRRTLVADGFDSDKLLSVTGVADRIPLPSTKPSDAKNRRIEFLVLTDAAAHAIKSGAPLMNTESLKQLSLSEPAAKPPAAPVVPASGPTGNGAVPKPGS